MANITTSITTRDKKLLLSFLGIALFVLSFMLIYRPWNEKTELLRQENQQKEEELARIMDLEEKEAFFISESETMKQESDEMIQQFPSNVLEEDGILLMKSLETKVNTQIDSMTFGTREFIYATDNTATTEEEGDSKTLSEQSGEVIQQRIDEIEGVTSNSDQNQTINYTGTERALYRNQDSIQFTIGYKQLKEMVQFFDEQRERITIDSLNLSYDNTTGQLSGDANINLFSMTADDTTYEQKDTGDISLGTDNIFGTIQTKKANK